MSDHSKHFDTAHLRDDLRSRSVRGGVVTLGSQGVKFALTMVSTAVLARLLTPVDFGLIAMVATVIGFAAIFYDLGLSMAIVQQESVTHEQASTLFWINIAVSLVLTFLVMAISPLIALLYGDERLILITIALGTTFIFSGLATQHIALLRRQMRFTLLASIDVVALLLSIAVAITIASLTHSYWALVAIPATQAIVTMLLSWLFSGWIPGKFQLGSGVRGMLTFGGHLTGFNTFNYFTRNFDNILIGAVLGPGPLGLYSRAYSLAVLPVNQLNAPLSSVAMPALSRLQSDPIAYRRFFLRTITLLSMVTIPIVTYTFADADLIVLAILGEQWTAVTSIFRWLAPAALVSAINIIPGWLCSSLGRTDVQMRWAIWTAPFVVMGFAIGLLGGPDGVAASFSVTFTIVFLIFVMMACRVAPVSPLDIWNAIRNSLLAALLASFLLLLLKQFAPVNDLPLLLRFCVTIPSFGFFFLVALCSTPSGRGELHRLLNLRNELRGRN